MNQGIRLLDLYSRQRADVVRMVVVRPGPRGTVIVRPECSADELQAVADRPFEPGAQVLVASAQGVASTYRVLGSLPSGLSGASTVTATRRSPLTGTSSALAPSCPSFAAVSLWAILGNSTEIALYTYASGSPGEQAWSVPLEGDWGPLGSPPWPLDVRRNGHIVLQQPATGGELAIATIKDGGIARWDMALDSGSASISRPVWDGPRVAVAVRRESGAALYRWDGSTHVDGIAPGMSWLAGPAGLPATLPGVEIAVGPSGQILYSEDGHLWQRIGSSWVALPDISGTSADLSVLDYRTALAGKYWIDLQAGTVALWQEWSEAGADIPLLYPSSGGVLGYPYRVDSGDSLISCALPPAGQRWSGDCPPPVVAMTVPSGGWSVAAVGVK